MQGAYTRKNDLLDRPHCAEEAISGRSDGRHGQKPAKIRDGRTISASDSRERAPNRRRLKAHDEQGIYALQFAEPIEDHRIITMHRLARSSADLSGACSFRSKWKLRNGAVAQHRRNASALMTSDAQSWETSSLERYRCYENTTLDQRGSYCIHRRERGMYGAENLQVTRATKPPFAYARA